MAGLTAVKKSNEKILKLRKILLVYD